MLVGPLSNIIILKVLKVLETITIPEHRTSTQGNPYRTLPPSQEIKVADVVHELQFNFVVLAKLAVPLENVQHLIRGDSL